MANQINQHIIIKSIIDDDLNNLDKSLYWEYNNFTSVNSRQVIYTIDFIVNSIKLVKYTIFYHNNIKFVQFFIT